MPICEQNERTCACARSNTRTNRYWAINAFRLIKFQTSRCFAGVIWSAIKERTHTYSSSKRGEGGCRRSVVYTTTALSEVQIQIPVLCGRSTHTCTQRHTTSYASGEIRYICVCVYVTKHKANLPAEIRPTKTTAVELKSLYCINVRSTLKLLGIMFLSIENAMKCTHLIYVCHILDNNLVFCSTTNSL